MCRKRNRRVVDNCITIVHGVALTHERRASQTHVSLHGHVLQLDYNVRVAATQNADASDTMAAEMPSRRLASWKAEAACALPTAKVEWEPDRDWKGLLQNLTEIVAGHQHTPYAAEFFKRQLAALAFDACGVEGTVSDEHRIGRLAAGENLAAANVEWDAACRGDPGSPATDRQLYQCAQAAKFLLETNISAPLSIDLIVRTHEMLMGGSYSVDGTARIPVVVGRLRTAADGTAGFGLQSRAVHGAVSQVVAGYNARAAEGGLHPVQAATYLFYELVTIRPFTHGTERLSRLFLAWSLLHDGFPFPVALSSGQDDHQYHLNHAIKCMRRVGGPDQGELNAICLQSMEAVLSNFMENVRLLEAADGSSAATPKA